jgi:hypothetical protein
MARPAPDQKPATWYDWPADASAIACGTIRRRHGPHAVTPLPIPAAAVILVALACRSILAVVGTPAAPPITSRPPTAQAAPPDLQTTEGLPVTPTMHLDIPSLTLDGLKNAEYHVVANGAQLAIPLAGGLYQQGSDPTSSGYLVATDAVVFLGVHQGGTGIDVHVAAVINWAGIPRPVASAFIDDRAVIQSVGIENGVILVNAIVHGVNDPACCPSDQVVRVFRLVDGSLVEQH